MGAAERHRQSRGVALVEDQSHVLEVLGKTGLGGEVAGDAGAAAVVERSAQALALMAATICTRLQLSAPRVWPMGGALEHLALLRCRLEACLEECCPGAQLQIPAADACSGALSLARECLEARPR